MVAKFPIEICAPMKNIDQTSCILAKQELSGKYSLPQKSDYYDRKLTTKAFGALNITLRLKMKSFIELQNLPRRQ